MSMFFAFLFGLIFIACIIFLAKSTISRKGSPSAARAKVVNIYFSRNGIRVHVSFSKVNAGEVCSGINKKFAWVKKEEDFCTGTQLFLDGDLTIPFTNSQGYTLCGLLQDDGGDGNIYAFEGNTVGDFKNTQC